MALTDDGPGSEPSNTLGVRWSNRAAVDVLLLSWNTGCRGMPPAVKPDTFYHLAEEPLWNAAVAAKCAYESRKYHEERFTRATVDPHALLAIANTFYKDNPSPHLLLWIDAAKLEEKGLDIKWESSGQDPDTGLPSECPHILGPLPLDAVIRTTVVRRLEDGTFLALQGVE